MCCVNKARTRSVRNGRLRSAPGGATSSFIHIISRREWPSVAQVHCHSVPFHFARMVAFCSHGVALAASDGQLSEGMPPEAQPGRLLTVRNGSGPGAAGPDNCIAVPSFIFFFFRFCRVTPFPVVSVPFSWWCAAERRDSTQAIASTRYEQGASEGNATGNGLNRVGGAIRNLIKNLFSFSVCALSHSLPHLDTHRRCDDGPLPSLGGETGTPWSNTKQSNSTYAYHREHKYKAEQAC